MSAAVAEEIELKLSDVFLIRTGALISGNESLRVELLANLLYLYDDSWKLEGDGVRVVVGNHQDGQSKMEARKPQVLKKVRKWLMLAELGHLVTGDSSLVEGKKFSRLVTGLMDRLEHKLGMEGLRGRVREVASIQARLGGKENFKSPAKVENKRLIALQQSPLVVQNRQLNSSTVSMEGMDSPDIAWIPTGKQLPRTPPSLNATDNSCLGDSSGNNSCSPNSRRISSFYSPSMTKVQGKARRDKGRAQLQVSASEFDMSVRGGAEDNVSVRGRAEDDDSSVPVNISTINPLAPPPGRQLVHSPVCVQAVTTSTESTESSLPAVTAPLSPPAPAVVAFSSDPLEASVIIPHPPPDYIDPCLSAFSTQDLHPPPQTSNRPLTPDLPPPPHPSDLPTTPVSQLLAKHHIPTGRQLPSTPQLQTAKLAAPVEPSGKYELPAELETVAIPTQEEVDRVERKRQEEEDMRQKKTAKEVERNMERMKKNEEIEQRKLEEAELQRRQLEEIKRQELVERQKIEDEKKMIAEMRQQLMEKAKMLEEKEKRLKHEEERRKQEELMKKTLEEESRHEELKKQEEESLKKELKKKHEEESLKKEELKTKHEEESLKKEELKTKHEEESRKKEEIKKKHEEESRQKKKEECRENVKKKINEDILSTERMTKGKDSTEGKRQTHGMKDLKNQPEVSENTSLEQEKKKLEMLAKEKKLRVAAEVKKKEDIKKSESRKQVLKGIEDLTSPKDKTSVDKLQLVRKVDDTEVENSACMPEIPRLEVLTQPRKSKSPGRKPSKYLKQTEAEMRGKQKREIMESKIEKRRFLVEQTIQKTEMARKEARVQIKKFEDGKMEKMLRKSIKSAEVNLGASLDDNPTFVDESCEDTSYQNNSKDDLKKEESLYVVENKASDNAHDQNDQNVVSTTEALLAREPSPEIKKKTIRIGRRPAKKAAVKEDTDNCVKVGEQTESVKENQVEPNKNKLAGETIPEKRIESTEVQMKSQETSRNNSNPEDIVSCIDNMEEADEATYPLRTSSADKSSSESILYPVASSRRRSICPKSVPETVQSKTRTSKRRPATLALQEESPPNKGKNISSNDAGGEKIKRGRKKQVAAVSEVVHESLTEVGVANEVVETGSYETEVLNLDLKCVKNVKNPRNQKQKASIVDPPIVHEESSLFNKLEKRRKRIEDTIMNPETAISASKIVKKVKTPAEKTSLEKKLSKQRQVVEENPEESRNPTPVKSLGRPSRRNAVAAKVIKTPSEESPSKRKASIGEVSPPKKLKETVGKTRGRKKLAPPELEADSSLFVKLEKRKKKIEETYSPEELTFTNKFTKKTHLTDSLEKKLTKQRNKVDDFSKDEVFLNKNGAGKKKSIETISSDHSKNDNKAGKVSKAVKAKESVAKKVIKRISRKSSEEQDYFTAAEESILLERPRRNCKKKFENLEGLASSSVSNTPTPVPVEADKVTARKFQFPKSKAPETVPDDKPAKKKPGRNPGNKAVKTAPEQTHLEDKTPTKPSEVQVIVHSPDESLSNAYSQHAKKTRKAKQPQLVPDPVKPTDKPSAENSRARKPEMSKPNPKTTATSRRAKTQVQCTLSTMDDEVYQTPSTKIVDEVYQTPRPMGSFSEVLDEEYKTPEETVRKPRRRQKREN